MIQFSEQDDEKITKVLWLYDGDFSIIDEIHPCGNRWLSVSSYLMEDTLEELKDRLKREYSHLN